MGHIYMWQSSATHYNSNDVGISENDLLFAAAILYSGNNFAKIEHFCNVFSLKCITEKMFYRYQQTYLVPVVDIFWKQHQDEILKR